jgi:hypothetical protein
MENKKMNNNIELGQSENLLQINGKIVGFDPSTFDRSGSYVENFEKIGNSKYNIKVVENFLSLEECSLIIDSLNSKEYVEHDLQIDDKNNPTIKRKSYMGLEIAGMQQKRVQEILEDSYDVKVIPGSAHVAKWEPGQKLELHVDDLGRTSYNHMASLIYLNDDYEGGEIEFPTHNLSLKLSAGSLIMFPGNANYPHEVKSIISGYRYTMPIWFSFI